VAKRKAQTPSRGTASRAAERRAGYGEVRFVESSLLVAALLEREPAARRSLRQSGRYVTSTLTFAEAGRAIIRAHASGRLSEAQVRAAQRALRTFVRRVFTLDLDRQVLERVAQPFPVEPVRTLDAVHLATAERLDESSGLVTVLTRDARVRDNARAMGFRVE